MKTRLDQVPVLEETQTRIDAHYFNRVRLAFRRVGVPLRIRLPRLRHLDIQLDEQVWVCVDWDLDDLPVLAFSDFQTWHRTALHLPIECRLRTFNLYARLIIPKLLEDTDAVLASQIRRASPSGR